MAPALMVLRCREAPPSPAARARSAVRRTGLGAAAAWAVALLTAGSCRSFVARAPQGTAPPSPRAVPSPVVLPFRPGLGTSALAQPARRPGAALRAAAPEPIPPTGPDPQKMAEAMSQMPGAAGTPLPGDLLGTGLFSFIIPLIIGLGAVYILIIVKPEAVLSPDQMVEWKRLEKQKELKRRGAKNLGGKKETRASRRKNLRKKLRGGKQSEEEE
mmetsp:Transcript_9523/g.19204  ORF Transcript_9523/g.19204 Transcript_9523/m.19204 type:complete len:215 (-) Transcript_9523:279-923(-)